MFDFDRKQVTAKPSSLKGINNLKNYCMDKEKKVVAGPWMDEASKDEKEEEYTGKDLKCMEKPLPWQATVIKKLEAEPDDRTVNVVVDKVGNAGKTKLCKWLMWKKMAGFIPYGKANDILNKVFKNPWRKSYVVDLSRSKPAETSIADIYHAIEQIKNGMITNGKWETGDKLRMPSHVWIFANFKPDVEAMSQDRWKFWTIQDQELVPMKTKKVNNGGRL